METKNSKVLADFTEYCVRNPELRFWQAVRNWSGYGYLLTQDFGDGESLRDTYYWEGRRHDD